MTEEDRTKLLLEMLVTAMLITLQKQRDEEEGEPNMPGLIGGPPDKGEPAPHQKHEPFEHSGFGSVKTLNKLTDLMVRSLQAAVRYRVALENNMIFMEEGKEPDDMDFLESTPLGVAFSMKFKRPLPDNFMKKLELAADICRSYFHYRLFEKDPTVSGYIEQIEWKDSVETDPDLNDDERVEVMAFFDEAIPDIVQILHLHHDKIMDHSKRVFNKALAMMQEIMQNPKPLSFRLDALFGGAQIMKASDVIKILGI